MDWFVLLTPLVVLGVLALLGYAGCHEVFGTDYVEPPPPPRTLTLEVRVPADLTILASRFRWIRPGTTNSESTTDLVRRDEGNLVVLSYVVGGAVGGSWRVFCRLEVRDATAQAEAVSAPYDFVLMDDTDGLVWFETEGRPSTNDFAVVAVGLQ